MDNKLTKLGKTSSEYSKILVLALRLKIVDFLDVLLTLRNGTYCPYKKPNDKLLYIHSLSNHPPNQKIETTKTKKYFEILFGLIHHSTKQYPQMLQIFFFD